MVLLLVLFFQNQEQQFRLDCDYYGLGLQLVAVFVSGKLSPAHLNPAATIVWPLKGGFALGFCFPLYLAPVRRAMLGQILVWLQFKPHYEAEENAGNILATFSTGPAIKDTVSNLISEILGTFVLVLTIFALGLYDLQAGIGTLQWEL